MVTDTDLATAGVSEAVTILIAGPTASGKSGLALALARRLGGRIINADSMQVYAEMAILTARPTTAEMALVPHRLYGVLPARTPCSAARWSALARTEIAAAHRVGEAALVVGGTGLYFAALTEGLADIPEIPANIRARLAAELTEHGPRALHRRLESQDPPLARRLKPADCQRILRALEVFEATGERLSTWQARGGTAVPDLGRVIRLALTPERSALLTRIEGRLERMAEAGALDEVRRVLALRLDPALPVMKVIGLRPFARHLAGEIGMAEAHALAVVETRQYAKRQMTWIRNRMRTWNLGNLEEIEKISSNIVI